MIDYDEKMLVSKGYVMPEGHYIPKGYAIADSSTSQPSTLNPQSSILNPQPSILNPQTSKLNPQSSNLSPVPRSVFSTRFMRSTAIACLLQVTQEEREDQDDGYDNSTPFGCQAAFARGTAVVAVVVRAVLIEGVGVFFGGFVREYKGLLLFIRIQHYHLL